MLQKSNQKAIIHHHIRSLSTASSRLMLISPTRAQHKTLTSIERQQGKLELADDANNIFNEGETATNMATTTLTSTTATMTAAGVKTANVDSGEAKSAELRNGEEMVHVELQNVAQDDEQSDDISDWDGESVDSAVIDARLLSRIKSVEGSTP